MSEQPASLPSLPRLNEPAPAFSAHTTAGPRALQDYAGRWLVLFSHPADFTPVCTTEFVEFSRLWPAFREIDCDLLGLSVDSAFSHIAWLRDIRQAFGIDVPFPVIEDSSRRIAHAYGMIHPAASDTSTVRGTFVIDPDGMLRAASYYPMTTGRSVAEILRLVRALQAAANHKVMTPSDWQPGQEVLQRPADTLDASGGFDLGSWYVRTRRL
ncbi:MAG: peroxiredoxin [Planctomycetota bacterium]